MSMLSHKNVLNCFGASTVNPDQLLILTEWIPNGTLRDLLNDPSVQLTM